MTHDLRCLTFAYLLLVLVALKHLKLRRLALTPFSHFPQDAVEAHADAITGLRCLKFAKLHLQLILQLRLIIFLHQLLIAAILINPLAKSGHTG